MTSLALADSDSILLLRHREGDAQAFRALFERYTGPIERYLGKMGVPVDQRCELKQDVFLKVHLYADRYEPDRPLNVWLFKIVANTAKDFFRKRTRRRRLWEDAIFRVGPLATNPTPLQSFEAQQTSEVLHIAFFDLGEKTRQAMLMSTLGRMSLAEVADAIEIPVNSVKTLIHRGRSKLRDVLLEHERFGGDISKI